MPRKRGKATALQMAQRPALTFPRPSWSFLSSHVWELSKSELAGARQSPGDSSVDGFGATADCAHTDPQSFRDDRDRESLLAECCNLSGVHVRPRTAQVLARTPQ